MNKIVLVVAACALMAWPAVAETVDEKTGINSTLGIAPTTKDFVQDAPISDMFEIASSKMASAKLDGPEKAFADQMITDRAKTTTELTDQAKADNTPIPAVMDSSHQSMLDNLNKLSGDAFRKQYFSDQMSGHKDAVSLFERYGKGGMDEKLKE